MRKKRETEETDENMLIIQAIENKYGLVLFRMGLTQLIDVGARHLTDENVEETFKQIFEKEKADREKGEISMMTPDFQCNIVRCAAELAKFSIVDIMLYIKKYVYISK